MRGAASPPLSSLSVAAFLSEVNQEAPDCTCSSPDYPETWSTVSAVSSRRSEKRSS